MWLKKIKSQDSVKVFSINWNVFHLTCFNLELIGAIALLLHETFIRWIENEQPELYSPVCIVMGYNNTSEDI